MTRSPITVIDLRFLLNTKSQAAFISELCCVYGLSHNIAMVIHYLCINGQYSSAAHKVNDEIAPLADMVPSA